MHLSFVSVIEAPQQRIEWHAPTVHATVPFPEGEDRQFGHSAKQLFTRQMNAGSLAVESPGVKDDSAKAGDDQIGATLARSMNPIYSSPYRSSVPCALHTETVQVRCKTAKNFDHRKTG
jgi:hypothetical protein